MNILVVEDEVRLAHNLVEALTLEKYTAHAVHTGPDAVAAVAIGAFDLIILDIMLPGQDGISVLRELRADGLTTPVVMLTALGTLDDKVSCLDAGADDYLTKPFAIEELLARVRALLRRPVASVAAQLACGSLVLDQGAKQVTRSGQTVALSATEYRLLEYLLLRQGEVISEGDIIDHVWDHNYDGLSNIVSVYIGYLRKKIDKAFPEEAALIQTKRGLGYSVSLT